MKTDTTPVWEQAFDAVSASSPKHADEREISLISTHHSYHSCGDCILLITVRYP